jgi:hypothetical protein
LFEGFERCERFEGFRRFEKLIRPMSLPIRISFVAVFILASWACGFWSMVVHQRMLDLVNAQLPADQRFNSGWWYFDKTQRLLREYRRLYPAGLLVRQLRRIVIIMGAAFGLAVFAFDVGLAAAILLGGGFIALQLLFLR